MAAKRASRRDLPEALRIAPGAHFTMGGLWSDYDQMTTVPGLFVGGEAGSNYHGANRLGANSLLSACVDGWFTLPFSVPNWLAPLNGTPTLAPDAPETRPFSYILGNLLQLHLAGSERCTESGGDDSGASGAR